MEAHSRRLITAPCMDQEALGEGSGEARAGHTESASYNNLKEEGLGEGGQTEGKQAALNTCSSWDDLGTQNRGGTSAAVAYQSVWGSSITSSTLAAAPPRPAPPEPPPTCSLKVAADVSPSPCV